MGKVITLHSSRGGTGKSLIAVNLAAIYAHKGRNVSLLILTFGPQASRPCFRQEIMRLLNTG